MNIDVVRFQECKQYLIMHLVYHNLSLCKYMIRVPERHIKYQLQRRNLLLWKLLIHDFRPSNIGRLVVSEEHPSFWMKIKSHKTSVIIWQNFLYEKEYKWAHFRMWLGNRWLIIRRGYSLLYNIFIFIHIVLSKISCSIWC